MAAAKLFSEKGYENTRTLDIAKEAGANEALIGRYFGGKEGLLTAVLKDETVSTALMQSAKGSRQTNELPARQANLDFVSALKVYFKNGNIECQQKEAFMRIAMSRSLVDRKMSKVVQEQIIDGKIAPLAESLNEYLDGAKLSKKQREAIAMLIAASNHTFNFLGRRIHDLDSDKVDLSLEILTESLRLYLEAHGKKK